MAIEPGGRQQQRRGAYGQLRTFTHPMTNGRLILKADGRRPRCNVRLSSSLLSAGVCGRPCPFTNRSQYLETDPRKCSLPLDGPVHRLKVHGVVEVVFLKLTMRLDVDIVGYEKLFVNSRSLEKRQS